MKKNVIVSLISASILIIVGLGNYISARQTIGPEYENKSESYGTCIEKTAHGTRIQVALLLDTSSSMDGLIDQAKSRLWNIVNTLTTLKFQGKTPRIEIALYEYGNNGIATDDYIRKIVPLSTDLDLLSEKLFSLTTWGGYEYCGAVIDKAVKELGWSNNKNDMKIIYIAGNEPFTQGRISYKDAINSALEKDIYVNTIHCGSEREGIEGKWRDGAQRGRGKFFNIDHNKRIRHVDTPFDAAIVECNHKLNNTYIGYGMRGAAKKESQSLQDKNAVSISITNMAERAVTKSKSAYVNNDWDLVEMVTDDKVSVEEIRQEELPKEYQGKTVSEIKNIIKDKEEERKSIQKEIETLAKKRQEYIDNELKNSQENIDDLGKAITDSVLEIAKAKGYIREPAK